MFEYWMHTDMNSIPDISRISGHVFTQDSEANLIGVRVTKGGEPVVLDGTVSANIIRADRETISVSGEMDGDRAWVILPSSAYAVKGKIQIFLKIADSNGVATIGAAEGTVYESMTSEVVS